MQQLPVFSLINTQYAAVGVPAHSLVPGGRLGLLMLSGGLLIVGVLSLLAGGGLLVPPPLHEPQLRGQTIVSTDRPLYTYCMQ